MAFFKTWHKHEYGNNAKSYRNINLKIVGFLILAPKIAPTILAVHTGPFKAYVSWDKIQELAWQDANINYVIEYSIKSDTASEKKIVVDSTQSSVELKDLKQNSAYNVSVSANNSVGGKRSEEFQFTTNSCKYFTDDNDDSLFAKLLGEVGRVHREVSSVSATLCDLRFMVYCSTVKQILTACTCNLYA